MKAVGLFIIIEVEKEEKKSASGLLLTNNEFDELRYGRAKTVSCGDLVKAVKPDQTIYYDKRNCFPIRLDGRELYVIQEREVVLVAD